MDRRSWLWRRKSFEKSPGETESSGSVSSHSERFSDDQVYSTQTTPSPEATSKAAPNEEVTNAKTITEKLSAALLNISSKEDLIKQHAKVAEEAVSGWEKAENEVLTLKQQLDAEKQKNSVLEDRVSHLDGELEECMRQLQQAREELKAQLQTAKADAAASVGFDLHQRLKDVEKGNSSLKIELQYRLEELEFRTIERDLSTQAAEKASKQHLESIKKVAKLEAECRRLKAMTCKTFSANDHRSLNASSVYVESFTDSMSDRWEMNEGEPSNYDSWQSSLITEDQFKNENSTGKNCMVLSTEINLMDDFLEMERLVALPDTESVSSFLMVGHASDQPNVGQGTVNTEVEALVKKNAALEKKLEKMEADKLELEMDLTECQKQLEASQNRIKEMELEVAELQTQLALSKKSDEEAYEELKETQAKNEIVESKLRVSQTEVEELISKICSLEDEIEKEQAFSAENLAKCGNLEDELFRMKHEAQLQQDTEILHREGFNSELNLKQEKELELAASRFSECRKTIESLGLQLKSLATVEDFLLDSENPMELTCQVTSGPHNGGEQLKLHNSDLSFPKRDSESSV
ncbi:filament-like plant protein 3 isoform X2 [Gastrolobium bilobum]|uniref:filament-like plant protein 3 isoform X2 n=1 Tax=Gastrolobium bilobum TaxID=150636 RepID=UPI002AB0A19B|nr:filament-like plant protein 3 isoform X2 [Gastrolobium bilobum]